MVASFSVEAPIGFEPMIRVLQTRALPLGYGADIYFWIKKWSGKRGSNPRPSRWQRDALSTELFPQQLKHYYNNKNRIKSQGDFLKNT